MNITDVRIRKIDNAGKLKGLASVTFDDVFVVHEIKVLEGDPGLYVAMPSKKSSDGTYRDIAHPITSAAREEISSKVLSAYQEA